MMRRISTPAELRLIAILLAALLALTAGCASNNAPSADTDAGTEGGFDDGMMDDANSGMDDARMSASDVMLPAVYFDLDSTEIRSEFRSGLEAGAMGLKDSGATVLIEGHCDERGSEEYNFALGERRAGAVRKYLFNLGVPMAQMTVVSYGEAQPAQSGRGESVWRLNRRADFRVR
jgi:peptidoglycan-associated lipoprotein